MNKRRGIYLPGLIGSGESTPSTIFSSATSSWESITIISKHYYFFPEKQIRVTNFGWKIFWQELNLADF